MTEEIRYIANLQRQEEFDNEVTELKDELKRLEQENKELKIYIESNKQQVEEAEMLVMDNDRLQQEVESLKDVIYYDVEKYRSALEEIKNDLKEVCKEECDYTKPKFCGDCDCRYGQILTKINEVLRCE